MLQNLPNPPIPMQYKIHVEPVFNYIVEAVENDGFVKFINVSGPAPKGVVICDISQIADWTSIYHLYDLKTDVELNQWFKPKQTKKSKKTRLKCIPCIE